MKINGVVKCPKCNSHDINAYQMDGRSFFDDGHYEFMAKEYPDTEFTQDYIEHKCVCENCDHFFRVRSYVKCVIEKYVLLETEI